MPRILIVEDEAEIRELIRFILGQENYVTLEASHAQEARQILASDKIDLILLDWMMPGRSGVSLLRDIKKQSKTKSIPVIMLTARWEEQNKVEALDAGADDYITKPFSPREMLARIRTVLRRAGMNFEQPFVEMGDLSIDQLSHQASINGKKLDLSPSEYRLLLFFMTHAERAYTRSQILDHVWGESVYVEERTVDVHILRLRKILKPFGYHRHIETVRSVGYRFTAPEEIETPADAALMDQ